MPNQNKTDEVVNPIANTHNKSQSELWERRLAVTLIVIASAGLLICIALLVQGYIIQKPAFILPIFKHFKPEFTIIGYYSIIFFIAGFLVLGIAALNIYSLTDAKSTKLNYILVLSSAVLLLFSFWLLFVSCGDALNPWAYLYLGSAEMAFIIINFSLVIKRNQKTLGIILEFISFLLIVIASVASLKDNN